MSGHFKLIFLITFDTMILDSNPDNLSAQPQAPIGKAALQYCFILSMISLLIFITSYYFKIDQNSAIYKSLNWILSIGGVIWFVWHYKTKMNLNRLRFGQGVGLSALTGLIAGSLTGLFIYIFITQFAPDYTDQLIEVAIREMRNQGQSDAIIKQSMEMVKVFCSPGFIGSMMVIGALIVYTVVGLITTAIIKNDR
jgi:Na+/H+-translocating membrane pyrophosphatase